MVLCVGGVLLGGSLAPIVVDFIDWRALRVFLDAACIPQHEGDADDGEHEPAHDAVFHAGEDGQVGYALRDADGEGVEDGACKADMGGDIAHAEAYYGVVAHGDGQWHEDDGEGYGLLAHAENGSEDAEHQHDEGDDYVVGADFLYESVLVEALHPPQECHDADVDGVAVVQYPEGAADHKDEDDDVGFVAEAVEERGKDLPRLRLALDVVEGVVFDDEACGLAAVGVADGDGLSHELSAGDEPCGYG